MFSIVASPTFTVPVLLSRPDADAPVKVDFTFKHKGVRELTAWMKKATEGTFATDAEFIDDIVAGWGPQIKGEGGDPLPYSLAMLERLLDQFPGAANEIVLTYRKRLKDARLGN